MSTISRKFLCFQFILMALASVYIIWCFLLSSLIQLYTWQKNFENSFDDIAQVQYIRMIKSVVLCILINCVILIAHLMSVYGPRGMIQFLYNITSKKWSASLIISIAFAKLFIRALCPWGIVQHVIQTIFRIIWFDLISYVGSLFNIKNFKFFLFF